jgi:cell pole-organizing protein PopZ
MSSPEASIEEILASIRKTFTDEPEAQGSKPVESYSEARPSGMPPFRSATETALSSGSTPLPTPPRSRAAAIDDDLDDLIDKSSQLKSASTPSETVVPQPAVPSPAVAVSPVEAAREKWANLLNPHSQSNGSAAKAAEVKSEVAPQPAPPAPAPAPAPASGLFAPRKGGFYPPQDARPDPILPMPAAAPPPAPAPAENASPATPSFGASAASTKESPPASAAPRAGFIPFPQTKSTAPEPAPAPATLSGATTAMTAPAPSAPAVSPASASVADVPAASARALDDLVAELNSVAHVPAESAAPAPVMLSEPLAPAPAPTAQSEPAPSTQTAAALSATATGTEAASKASASRSFEDVVADMLRPLLEKWIDENMPRIVERALQRDAALGRKPGL